MRNPKLPNVYFQLYQRVASHLLCHVVVIVMQSNLYMALYIAVTLFITVTEQLPENGALHLLKVYLCTVQQSHVRI